MRRQTRAALAIGVAVVVALLAVLLTVRLRDDPAPAAVDPGEVRGGDTAVLRDDSRVLGEEGSSGVTFVEFLDFECEACAAAYPIVEDLREQYAGEVTFALRYFPLPGHPSSQQAARAVESAARQGALEDMYSMMYETQTTWSHSQEPQDAVFRTFAEEIGLDMEQYDADYASDDVADRVARDLADAEELGLTGTPSFFVDGEPFEPRTVDDFSAVLDEALAR